MANDRTPRDAEIINYALDLFRAGLYVGRPVRVDAVDTTKGTVDVIPMLTDNYTDASDELVDYSLPIIPAIPILFPEGGDFVDTWPIKKGDQGWILFADRSLDQWQQKGNKGEPVNPLTEFRHSLPAKGLFLPGGRSVKEAFSQWDPDRRVIGAKDGPRLAFTATKVHIGVDHQESAPEMAACSSKCMDNFNSLRTEHNNLKNDFNNHFHQLTSAGSPFSHTGVTNPPASPSSATVGDMEDVACKKVGIK